MDFKSIYKGDVFANEAGIKIVEITDDYAIAEVMVTGSHVNGGGMAHGGLIFTLCDISMAAIANHHQAISVSIQSDIRFLTASKEGDLLSARATMILGRKRLFYGRTEVTNQDGALIAVAEGMFHTKRVD